MSNSKTSKRDWKRAHYEYDLLQGSETIFYIDKRQSNCLSGYVLSDISDTKNKKNQMNEQNEKEREKEKEKEREREREKRNIKKSMS